MRQTEILITLSKASDAQKQKAYQLMEEILAFHRDQEDTLPEVCPVCGKKSHFIKKGKQCGKQRYQCCDCNHKFVYDSHTITSCMKISRDEFIEICNDTIRCVPIKDTAKRLNRSVPCVFENRHKFLCLLEKSLMEEEGALSGTCKFDEKYILESSKGVKTANRKARHRGEPSRLRGISHEQICIVTTTDRTGHEIFRTVGRARPTSISISEIFGKHICENSILYTDGIRCYDKMAEERKCRVVHLHGHEMYNKVEHLNTVNSIHSMIEEKIRFYRGVSTKYLNRYCSLFVVMRRLCNLNRSELMDELLKKIKWAHISIHRNSLKTKYILDI